MNQLEESSWRNITLKFLLFKNWLKKNHRVNFIGVSLDAPNLLG